MANCRSASAASNRLVLGQKKVEGKSNEITALPELIKILDLAGCIVTVETRYFISSLENDAQKLAEAIRCYWSIKILFIGYLMLLLKKIIVESGKIMLQLISLF